MCVRFGRCSIDEFSAKIILILVVSIAWIWRQMISVFTKQVYCGIVKWKFLQQLNLLWNFVQSVVLVYVISISLHIATYIFWMCQMATIHTMIKYSVKIQCNAKKSKTNTIKCEDNHNWIIVESDCYRASLMPHFDIVHAVTPYWEPTLRKRLHTIQQSKNILNECQIACTAWAKNCTL